MATVVPVIDGSVDMLSRRSVIVTKLEYVTGGWSGTA